MKYKTSDLAKLLGVTTNTIRRYENYGYLTPQRDESDYRWYGGYDISRTAVIRLYLKCGFSHSEIMEMLDNDIDKILDVCDGRLIEMDEQLKRMKYLRHWLKDNIQMMRTCENIGDGFMIMDSVALKYVLYSKGSSLLGGAKRHEIINKFMYAIPEVQLIRLFKNEDYVKGEFIPYDGWAMKIMDIEKFGEDEFINSDSDLIETYPTKKCLYGVMNADVSDINDEGLVNKGRNEYFKRAEKYMAENSYELDGDIMEIMVSAIGENSIVLVCMPIKGKMEKKANS